MRSHSMFKRRSSVILLGVISVILFFLLMRCRLTPTCGLFYDKYSGAGKCPKVSTRQSKFPWTELRHRSLTMYLYGAYWDQRKKDEIAVRILAMISDDDVKVVRLFCHLWYNDTAAPVLMLGKLDSMWQSEDMSESDFRPYLISCPLPHNFRTDSVPHSVTLSETYTECSNVSNVLPIIYEPLPHGREEQLNIAICHKALHYQDLDVSSLIIEWLEIHRILWVEKVFMYQYDGINHPNISKVLSHYKKERKFFELKSYSLPGPTSRSPNETLEYLTRNTFSKWLNELIPYHDCFYRNMYRFKFIALVDINEVILPVNGWTWLELLASLGRRVLTEYPDYHLAGYKFKNHIFYDNSHLSTTTNANFAQFYPEFPPHMHMLQNVQSFQSNQSSTYTDSKLIFRTENALLLQKNWCMGCVEPWGTCMEYEVEEDFAHLHHYMWRGLNDELAKDQKLMDEEPMPEDEGMWNYESDFILAVEEKRKLIYKE